MQLVSHGKTSMSKNILQTPSFKVAVRTNQFNDVNSVKYDNLLVTDCLDELVEMAIDKAVNHERSPAAFVGTGVVEMIYHKANQAKYAGDLFQPDVKAVYKAFKVHLASITNRYDLVYLSAINDFLTESVNDLLYPILNTYPMIESFVDDFNELLRSLRNNCSADVEDMFVDQINEVLNKTHMNLSISEDMAEKEEPQEDDEVQEPKAQHAVIPMPVQIICLNYISAELGSQDNLAKMLLGLQDIVDGHVSYVCTIDKTIYKAFFGGEGVVLDLLRD